MIESIDQYRVDSLVRALWAVASSGILDSIENEGLYRQLFHTAVLEIQSRPNELTHRLRPLLALTLAVADMVDSPVFQTIIRDSSVLMEESQDRVAKNQLFGAVLAHQAHHHNIDAHHNTVDQELAEQSQQYFQQQFYRHRVRYPHESERIKRILQLVLPELYMIHHDESIQVGYDTGMGYQLAVALPEFKLGVELLPPSAYSLNDEKYVAGVHQFRLRMLSKQGWQVIRISTKEWQQLHTFQDQREFLIERIKLVDDEWPAELIDTCQPDENKTHRYWNHLTDSMDWNVGPT